MSVNTAHANGGVLIHAGETILLFSDNTTIEFSGQDGPMFKGTKHGRIYLTTHRIIFNSKNAKDSMQSFSSPFISMSDVELEQPIFGANYIKGKIRAQPNGNWSGEVKFKLSFQSGGCIDFGQALLRAASMAQRNGGGMSPPPYTPPTSGWYAAPPPSYTPSAGSYGWLPQNSGFGSAPANGVFMHDNPPPYPGINSNYNVTPGPSYPTLPPASSAFQNTPSAPMTKDQEAAASAYFDPRAPNSAFVQQPQFYENPPAYSELDQMKKKD
ncbi:CLUMA_CG000211, isoform A [Clunio marinus]|uniref:CLUMA_CG000211, isoform A n=1 Tax=Clunio marinus TaxID=568069 RepID=A0A1J1HDZ0_9DIPT|nr:CLUMA_CG000211, isoform A [Clunio marinus]